jgi:hypothetical protein
LCAHACIKLRIVEAQERQPWFGNEDIEVPAEPEDAIIETAQRWISEPLSPITLHWA